jgi:hypothetical protein
MTAINGIEGVTRTLWITSVVLATLVLSGPVHADWAEDFDGGFDQTWVFLAIDDEGDPPSAGVSEFDIVDAGADDYLRISHSETAAVGGGGGATDGFGYVDETFTAAMISADINAAPGDGQQNILGVFGRGDAVSGTAYIAGIDFAHSFFAIAAADDFFDSLFILTSDTSVAIDSGETYRVEFLLIESYLFARLIEITSGDTVSTLMAEDNFYASGFSGLLVETEYAGTTPVAPIIGTFDNVQAVPEASIMSLLGWGVGGLVLIRRRKLA